MKPWNLKRTVQCAKCPWRKDVDPRDIPNGYSEAKHQNLRCTIAEQAAIPVPGSPLKVMACHENHDAHCVGWLKNQIGPGNNIGLRLQLLSCRNAAEIRTVGAQHETFDETLPKTTRRGSGFRCGRSGESRHLGRFIVRTMCYFGEGWPKSHYQIARLRKRHRPPSRGGIHQSVRRNKERLTRRRVDERQEKMSRLFRRIKQARLPMAVQSNVYHVRWEWKSA